MIFYESSIVRLKM